MGGTRGQLGQRPPAEGPYPRSLGIWGNILLGEEIHCLGLILGAQDPSEQAPVCLLTCDLLHLVPSTPWQVLVRQRSVTSPFPSSSLQPPRWAGDRASVRSGLRPHSLPSPGGEEFCLSHHRSGNRRVLSRMELPALLSSQCFPGVLSQVQVEQAGSLLGGHETLPRGVETCHFLGLLTLTSTPHLPFLCIQSGHLELTSADLNPGAGREAGRGVGTVNEWGSWRGWVWLRA